jgi:hypothetical protein
MMVFPAHAESPPTRRTAVAPKAATKEFLEGVAVDTRIACGVTAATELKTSVPVWRWTRVLPGFPLLAELIVGRAPLRVLEHLVGLTQGPEALFRIGLLTHVRVVLPRELAISSLDLVLLGVARDTQ